MAKRAPKPQEAGKGGDQPADAPRPRRGRAKAATETAPAALDVATYTHHVLMIQGAHMRLEEKLREAASERGVLGNAKKAAKKAGVPVDAVMKALGLKKRPAGEVVAEFRDIGKVLKILEAPLGTQWGLFNDVETVDVMDADAAGYHAGKNSEPKSNNPHAAGTEEFVKWDSGWDRWVAENAPGAKPKNGGGDPTKAKVEAEFEQEGRDAYKAGVKLTDNPHREGTKANPLWNAGWKAEQTDKVGGGDEADPPEFLDRRKKTAAAEAIAH